MEKLPNIVPVTDFRKDAAKILQAVRDSTESEDGEAAEEAAWPCVASASVPRAGLGLAEPTVVTQRGRAAAVMVSVPSYERTQSELAVLRALLRGEQDIAAGDVHHADDVFRDAAALLDDEPEGEAAVRG